MLTRINKAMAKKDSGFTLIELLVVMIIIGILAAIAIPVFLSQREKAQDSATKADASTVGKEIATYYVDGTDVPSISDATDRYVLTAGDLTNPIDLGAVSNNVTLNQDVDAAATATTWCVSFENTEGSEGNTIWSYSAQDGLQSAAC